MALRYLQILFFFFFLTLDNLCLMKEKEEGWDSEPTMSSQSPLSSSLTGYPIAPPLFHKNYRVRQRPAEQHISVFLSDAPVFLLTLPSTLASSLCRLCRSTLLSLPPLLPSFVHTTDARGLLPLENNHMFILVTC